MGGSSGRPTGVCDRQAVQGISDTLRDGFSSRMWDDDRGGSYRDWTARLRRQAALAAVVDRIPYRTRSGSVRTGHLSRRPHDCLHRVPGAGRVELRICGHNCIHTGPGVGKSARSGLRLRRPGRRGRAFLPTLRAFPHLRERLLARQRCSEPLSRTETAARIDLTSCCRRTASRHPPSPGRGIKSPATTMRSVRYQ